MDFVRLGERYTTEYQPDILIEGYNSLIWTERFYGLSEFELKTFDVAGVSSVLPEDTLVSHLETQEVLMVHTHSIEMVGEEDDAVPELTVRGYSAGIMADNRFVESEYGKKRRMRKKYSAAAAACVLLYNAFDNNSGKDVTRGDDDPEEDIERNDYSWTTKDKIPNIAITDSAVADGELRWWQLTQGMLYPQLQRILNSQDLAFRVLRPISPNPATVVTVDAMPLADRGKITRTANPDVQKLRFDVYGGVDKSNEVQFSLLQGHMIKPAYLDSYLEYKTALEVMSGTVSIKDVTRTGQAALSGWERKVMAYDAGTPEIPPEPQKPKEPRSNATPAQRQAYREALDEWQDKWAAWDNKRDRIVDDFREEEEKAALKQLRKKKVIHMFSGDVSSLSPYQYKVHYDLGDTVTLFGDYGRSAEMVVSEFVRTEDINGDRGFPGLVAPGP